MTNESMNSDRPRAGPAVDDERISEVRPATATYFKFTGSSRVHGCQHVRVMSVIVHDMRLG